MKIRTKIIFTILIAFLMVGAGGCGDADSAPTPTETLSQAVQVSPTEIATLPENTAVPESTPQAIEAPIGIDTPWDDRSVFRAGLISSEQDALDEMPGANMYHMDIQISDDFLQLTGWEEVHYTNQEADSLPEIYFQLFPNAAGGQVAVSDVTVDDQEVAAAYEFENTALRVPLPTPLQPGASVDIRLEFVVDVPQEMAGNYGLFGYFDEVLVLDEFYPVIPVYDDEGWNVQVPPPNADTSYFDMSFYLVRVTAPAGLTIAASGVEVAHQADNGRQIVTFAAGPMRDFYLAGSEHFAVVSATVGETVLNSYVLQDHAQSADTALQFARNALHSFGERFGLYPYTEFDVLSTPMLALGIEYPGIVGITLPAYDPAAEVAGLPFPIMLESVVAHEVAHQWFYNIIGNDQIDEPWLDEAHAQYATWLYYLDVYGEAGAQGYRDSWDGRWQRVEGAEIPIGLPAYEYEGVEYGAIVYGRGPIFLEALSEEMGAAAFDAFLRDYYEAEQWGIVTTEAYRQLAEAHCGCDLSALFESWVYPQ
ncbi:MAG: M1 family metallopeptidase [Anaerolineales bacterium]|nr:M1 family metallopeptidase [Anaerolineales bacterium]